MPSVVRVLCAVIMLLLVVTCGCAHTHFGVAYSSDGDYTSRILDERCYDPTQTFPVDPY